MLAELVEGLYEELVTAGLEERVAEVEELDPAVGEADSDLLPQLLARFVHDRTLVAFRSLPAEERSQKQVELANRLLGLLRERAPKSGVDETDQVGVPARVLRALVRRSGQAADGEPPVRPHIPSARATSSSTGCTTSTRDSE